MTHFVCRHLEVLFIALAECFILIYFTGVNPKLYKYIFNSSYTASFKYDDGRAVIRKFNYVVLLNLE